MEFINNALPNAVSNILTMQSENTRTCHTSYFLKPPVRANTENAKQCLRHSIPYLINNFERSFIEKIRTLTIPTLKKIFK